MVFFWDFLAFVKSRVCVSNNLLRVTPIYPQLARRTARTATRSPARTSTTSSATRRRPAAATAPRGPRMAGAAGRQPRRPRIARGVRPSTARIRRSRCRTRAHSSSSRRKTGDSKRLGHSCHFHVSCRRRGKF